jgi:hypothetical protein
LTRCSWNGLSATKSSSPYRVSESWAKGGSEKRKKGGGLDSCWRLCLAETGGTALKSLATV